MRPILLCILAALPVLASCSAPPGRADQLTKAPAADPAVGSWSLDAPRFRANIVAYQKQAGKLPPDATEDHPDIKEILANVARMKYSLRIDPAGTFTATTNFGGSSALASGTWQRSADDLVLQTTKEDGREPRDRTPFTFRTTGPSTAEVIGPGDAGKLPIALKRD